MSIEIESRPTDAERFEQYRSMSTAAVAALLVGLLSCLAILDWSLVGIPIIGIVLSIFALRKVRRNAAELTGSKLAAAGLVLSLFFAIVGPAWLTYSFITELPEGYERVSYSALQPDADQVGQVVPPSALELEGKKIFIKGFIYPSSQSDGIQRFLLCRDQGECCFGGNPKLTDRIEVALVGSKRLKYQPRLHKVGGKFHVEAKNKVVGDAKGGVLYHLEADYLE